MFRLIFINCLYEYFVIGFVFNFMCFRLDPVSLEEETVKFFWLYKG